MSCSHAAGCPLFPLLNSSLQGWRDYYCDTGDRWQDCARYKLSLSGERVPISLLPNGHHAAYLAQAPGVANPLDPRGGRPAAQGPEPHRGADRSEPVRGRGRPQKSSPPAPSGPSSDRAAGTRQPPGAKRGWWRRLVDWMSGPA